MAKALRVLLGVCVLLGLDAALPRPGWLPPPLLSRSYLQAHLWHHDTTPAPTLVADSSGPDAAEEEESPPRQDVTHALPPPIPASNLRHAALVGPPAPPGTPLFQRGWAAVRRAEADSRPADAFVAAPNAGWDDFRGRLAELEAGQRTKVRVVQLGDSEIAGDWVSRTLRKQFGRRYGEGGPGFALALAPWPWYWREGYVHARPDGFAVRNFVFGHQGDGNYGPGGIGFDSTRKGASATVRLQKPPPGSCEVAFHYGTSADGGDVSVSADGAELDRMPTAGADRTPLVKHYTLKTCPGQLTATALSDKTVRIFGWSVESSRPGIVWSSLGVLSASASHLHHYSRAQLVQALENLRPDLVVVGYGLNLVHSGQAPPRSERALFESLLGEMREGLPEARCLALSPYPIVVSQDGALEPSAAVSVLARYQREAALQAGCAFLDRERMAGGPSTGLRWLESKPRYLSGDYVHLTEIGSEHMGMQIARVLLDVRPEAL
jgi:hypothetical protein